MLPGEDGGPSWDGSVNDGGVDDSGGYDAGSDSSTDDSGGSGTGHPYPTHGPATGLSIRSVAAFQAIKVPLFEAGSVLGSRNAPLVAGRETLFRVYVDPDASWTPHPVQAALTLHTSSGPRYFTSEASPSGASSDADASSLFEFEVPADAIQEGAQLEVELLEAGGTGGAGASTPAFDLDARENGGIDLVIVPVIYNADGSGRTPDTSESAMEALRQHLMAVYSFGEVRIRVREPVAYAAPVGRLSAVGWDNILDEIFDLRASDGAPNNEYYLGLFDPAANFGAYCQGRCIAGLAYVNESNTGATRVGVALGWAEENHRWSQIHELGHTMGRKHAPCGGAGDPDLSFPSSSGNTDVLGYDFRSGAFLGATSKDLMGYCDPNWVSAYTLRHVHNRAASINGGRSFSARLSAPHLMVRISPFQTPTWRSVTVDVADETEEVVMLQARDADGRPLARVAARELRVDHSDSVRLLIPYAGAATSFELPDGRILTVPSDLVE